MTMRIVVRRIKPPSFNGRHNATKSKALLALEDYRLGLNGRRGKGLTARQIHMVTGCPYNSILSSVGKWVRWKLILRREARNVYGRMVYHYVIAQRGRRWLERHAWRMPLERYFREMDDTRQRRDLSLGTRGHPG